MAIKHSLTRNFNEAVNLEDLKFQIGEFVSRLEDYLDARIDLYVIDSITSPKAKRPTFKKGDIVFDFSLFPGFATLQQWNGEELVIFNFGSFGGALPQVFNITPAGAIDGVNLVFTSPSAFSLGTTRVYYNGIRQELGVDYNETAANTITFTYAPLTGGTLILDYNTT